MLERTDAIQDEVLEPTPFVLTYPTLYGRACVGDYLIVAMKECQHAPFQGRQDCLGNCCYKRKTRNIWARTQERQSLHSHPYNKRPVLVNLMFIGLCIIVIVEEWKTSLMSLAILFHFLCAQHVSDINISIIGSLRLCCCITTSVALFSVRYVLELWCGWFWVLFVLQDEVLQPATRALLKTSRTKAPTHNELRTRRPMR